MIKKLRTRVGWRGLTGLSLLLFSSLLTACAVSLPGGLAGILVVISLGGLLFGLGGASSGCSSSSSCFGVDSRVGPCLGMPQPDGGLDVRVGPCLQPPPRDGGDTNVGPCLGALPPDGAVDAPVGPCLDPLPPDLGRDAPISPCLSLPPRDASASLMVPEASPSPADARRELLARHAAALPEDVVARLRAGRSGADDPEA